MQVSGGIQWVMVVNLVIWTGLFLYLRRLDGKLRQLSDLAASAADGPAPPAPASTEPLSPAGRAPGAPQDEETPR